MAAPRTGDAWIGRPFGPYEVTSLLGAGGMGEVYRAHDPQLGRDVAIKFLPRPYAEHPDRLARFEREARALAALNHPNIATIHGIEAHDGERAIVMELVDGETLASRLRRGRLPLEEGLELARQIADALDAAHERGIVHRDLKPANIAITTNGVAKILDFGLARIETEPGAPDAAHGPSQASTVAIGPTGPGLIVGTAAYMSPEQARGQPVDKRTDIWAFGCVLFEMVSGRAAFARDTTTDTLAAVLDREPDWSAVPDDVPTPLRRLLRRCLEKNRRRRLHDIADARLELDEVDTATPAAADRPTARAWVRRGGIGVALLAAAVVGGLLARQFVSPAAPAAGWGRNVVSFTIAPADDATISPFFVLSPDGRQLVWLGSGSDDVSRLWLRRLESPDARALPGTEGASWPFWSPDGRSVGFIQNGRVRRLDVASGSAQDIADTAQASLGAAWSPAGVIVFSARLGLFEVSESGGEITQVAAVDRSRQEDSLRYPQFLPDGRRFLYTARSGRRENSSVYVASLDGEPTQRLFAVQSKVEYASGHLLYVQDGTLLARAFDPESLAVGDPMAVANGVGGGNRSSGLGARFTTSANGVLAYQGETATLSQLQWFDRAGRPHETLGTPQPYTRFRIAPDGHRVATAWADERTGVRSVWILDPDRTTPLRLTFGDVDEWQPLWAPGDRIAFVSSRNGSFDLYMKSSTGAGGDEPLIVDEEIENGEDWSSQGDLAFYRNREVTRRDLYVLPADATPTPGDEVAIADSAADESDARFSPDGRWIVYVSDETGRQEVYVQPFPTTGGKWQVSVEGAGDPAWTKDGRELLYLALDGMLNAVDVTAASSSFRTGAVKPLFRAGRPVGIGGNRYDVTADGDRFLVLVPLPPPPPEPVVVVINWGEALGLRTPTGDAVRTTP